MKKFLFTLAALMMMGSAYADDYYYIEDFEVAQSELGTELMVPVKAHLDHYVSAFRIQMTLPEGITYNGCEAGEDLTLHYTNRQGRPATSVPVPAEDVQGQFVTILVQHTVQTYENGVAVGVAHYTPGDYEEVLFLYLAVAEDFKGGDMLMVSEPTAGGMSNVPEDEWCPKNSHYEYTAHITAEAGEPVVTDAPEIVVTAGDDAYIFDVVGPEGAELWLFVDGVEVEIPYTVARTDVDQVVKLTAISHIEGQIDGTVTGEYIVPALPVVEPEDLTGELVIGDPDENGNVTINYTGDENVTIVVTVNGEVVEVVDGVITVGEGESEIIVTVTAEGYNPITMTKTVTWTAPQPEVTATPTIEVTEGEDAYVVTVVGDGELHLYCNNVEVEFPYTIARGETDVTYYFTATAKEEGKEISATAELEVVVPAKAGEQPEDPHMTGYWLVVIDAQNNLHWNQLSQGPNGDYSTTVGLDCATYGDYIPVEDDSNRPFVPYYFVVDGVVYGAQYEDQPTVLGDAMSNPLVAESENYYNVLVGYNYTLGIAIVNGNEYYVYASRAGGVGIDELVEGKQVAGVRYFNMAGQEMQEANGMTIVVTTYTDGTTSAVKVMK